VPITADLSREVPDDVDAVAVAATPGQVPEGIDGAFLDTQGFEGRAGDVRAVPGEDGRARYVVGLGPLDDLDTAVLRRAAGNLGRTAGRHRSIAVDVASVAGDRVDAAGAATAVAEGLVLGAYHYTALKSSPTPNLLERLVFVGGGGKRVQAALDRGTAAATSTSVARDLVNEPGGSLTPPRFADLVVDLGSEHGFEVEVWDEQRIREERLGGLLGVNRGSQQPPRFLLLRLEPERARTTLALVGKGITFDSGGLSLKPTEGMTGMKGDMGGAAAVVGAFVAAATLGSRARLLGFVPLTDNMTGPDATRIGDVLTIRDGTTVEVLNTDAEGRLILADALCLATEAEPDAVVDVATLTGACMVALGERVAGLMGNHRGLAAQVQAASEKAGEPVWPLPLPADLRPKLDSDVADLKNISGGRYGGALTAGLFLERFVGERIAWAHLDIAGPAFSSEVDGELPKGGTGFGVRTLAALAAGFTRPKPAER
jgi:leucyl aminopeptidase